MLKSCSLLRLRQNDVIGQTVGLPTVCEVHELACGGKQGNSVCIYMSSDTIPARGEESGGSSFLHMVPDGLDIHEPSGKHV